MKYNTIQHTPPPTAFTEEQFISSQPILKSAFMPHISRQCFLLENCARECRLPDRKETIQSTPSQINIASAAGKKKKKETVLPFTACLHHSKRSKVDDGLGCVGYMWQYVGNKPHLIWATR